MTSSRLQAFGSGALSASIAGGAPSGSATSSDGGTSTGGGAPKVTTLSFDLRCASGELPLVKRRLLNRQFDHTVRDLVGVAALDARDGIAPSELLVADAPGPLTAEAERAYQDVARVIAEQVVTGPLRDRFLVCDPAAAECLSSTILSFGRRAFRRPLSDAEVLELETSLPADGTPDERATELLARILTSPHFIDIELDSGLDQAPGQVQLTSHELATRLAYFLWDSMPDEELDAAADADQLQTSVEISAQVWRMLQDPRLHEAVARFHAAYLGMDRWDHWGQVVHDPEISPGFTPEVQQLAKEELEAFFDNITFSQGTFGDLFLSNFGRINRALAPFYGLSADDYGDAPEPVALDPVRRPGFLTRLWFLSSFAHVDDSAPILRGSFIGRFILGIDPGTSDPNGPQTPTPKGEFPTLREYVEEQTSPPYCKGCHYVFINPPGFALENYDQVGQWRTVDPRGGPIDPLVDVYVSERPVTVESPLDFMQKIAQSRFAQRQYLDKLVSDAWSQEFSAQQACLSEDMAALLADPDLPLLELWRTLATSEAFRRNWVTRSPLPL